MVLLGIECQNITRPEGYHQTKTDEAKVNNWMIITLVVVVFLEDRDCGVSKINICVIHCVAIVGDNSRTYHLNSLVLVNFGA